MPPKGKRQTRLGFQPVSASSSSPVASSSAPKAGSSRKENSSPVRHSSSTAAPSSSARSARLAGAKKAKQGRLDDSSLPFPPTFLPKPRGRRSRTVANVHSEDSDAENSDEPNTRAPQSSQSVSTRLNNTTIFDDGDDEEEELGQLVTSPIKRGRPIYISLDDSDDAHILPPNSASKAPEAKIVSQDDSDEDVFSPAKKRKLVHHSPPSVASINRTGGRLKRPNSMMSSPIKKAHKGHRSEKQKKMELLRRRRAGEKIDQLTSSESSSDEDEKRGIYDSDSEGRFEVLKEFDDEEEGEVVKEKPAPRKDKGKREKPKAQNSDESDLDDFVTDDDDAPLGAPMDIPLEFTSHAHKPLKQQFPFVIEWLVHNRINPAFERRDPIYVHAWRKLDDEFSGLANSKFISSVWRPNFLRALKSRPRLEAFELTSIDPDLSQACEACGRSGHPSTSKIILLGSPYHKDTLVEVESDSDSEDDDDDDDTASVDTQGMPLPPTTKAWNVGRVCCDNATIAHSLLHWKHALKEWVEDRLENEGWMTPEKLRQREKMKAKSRRMLANSIADEWQEKGIVNALYGDFKNQLETARSQATTGRGTRGKFR
ncbi:hypothetical protein F4861DRAFT_181050 [Xylaria intraflava]|nr:hypothetical protein F4861DRAFT_181050 [Xylaria intraflava]